MSLQRLLDHKCDIFHVVKGEDSPGFALPPSPTFDYPDEPDAQSVICHFGVGASPSSSGIRQREPQNDYEARIKLTLPTGTDIRLNDKIRDCSNGLEFTAEIPKSIRGHHIIVYIQRATEQRPL